MTAQALAKSLLQKGVMKRRATGEKAKEFKYKLTSLDPSLSEGMSAAGLFKAILMKAAGHKYTRRTGGAGNYKYWYKDPKTGKLYTGKSPEATAKWGAIKGRQARQLDALSDDEKHWLDGLVQDAHGITSETKSVMARIFNNETRHSDAAFLSSIFGIDLPGSNVAVSVKEDYKQNVRKSLSKAHLRKSYEGVVTGEYYGTEGERESRKKKPGTSAILGKDMDSSLAGNGNDMAMLATMLNGGQPWRSGILY